MQKTFPPSQWTSSQLMGNNDFEIYLYRDKDFQTVCLHSHDFFELYFFISGSAGYIIENGKYRLESGDMLLIPPDSLHQLDITDSRETYERIVLWLRPHFIKKLSTRKTDLSVCFRTCAQNKDFLVRNFALSEEIRTLLLQLYSLRGGDEFGNDVESENIVRNVLLALGRDAVKAVSIGIADSLRPKTSAVIAGLVDYIDANIGGNLSLDALAEAMYTSKYYLCRLFKEETNSTLHQYVLKKRLVLSKRYISDGMPINQVCLKCGFIDYSHYFRAFRQEFGITPKQYYKLIKT